MFKRRLTTDNMHKVGFGHERKVCSMNEIHAEPTFPCDYATPRNGYCMRVMTSTAESKRIFKNHKLH